MMWDELRRHDAARVDHRRSARRRRTRDRDRAAAATRHFLADEPRGGAGAARADLDAATATDPETGALRGWGRRWPPDG